MSSKMFMPFRDFTLFVAGKETLLDVYKKTGLKHFVLAFVNLNSWDPASEAPSWAGQNDPEYIIKPGKKNFREDQIKELREVGGDIAISFGGAFGQHEPAIDIKEIPNLVACYQKIIDSYNVKHLDWDIEGGEVTNVEANKRRAKAIKILMENNPGLKVSMTLPVNTDGLALDGLKLLQTLKDENTPITFINGMSMEFGWYYKGGPMSDAIISSCKNLQAQADAMGWGTDLTFGTTPMIGQSYAKPEVVYPDDYSKIINFLKTNPRQNFLGFWSIDRDNGNGGRDENASYDRSGLPIADFTFTKICLKGLPFSEPPLEPVEPPSGCTCSVIRSIRLKNLNIELKRQ